MQNTNHIILRHLFRYGDLSSDCSLSENLREMLELDGKFWKELKPFSLRY